MTSFECQRCVNRCQVNRIQVGDQVPIATTQQSGTDTTSNLVNSIEYRDTGVMLTVTPRVNPGGLVIMDVEQEVSDVTETTTSGLDSPTIQTRNVTSSVAVLLVGSSRQLRATTRSTCIRTITANSVSAPPLIQTMPRLLLLNQLGTATATGLALIVVTPLIRKTSRIQ